VEQISTIQVTGTGSFLPDSVLTNQDLEKMVDTSDEWIITRTGISERRIAKNGLTTSDMAAMAAQKALEKAGRKPEEIDVIIVATVTSDYMFPSTACLVQKKIGAVNAAAFDLSAACSGFLYALISGFAYINSGCYKNVLIIGAESLSKITDWTDRSTCVLFGDGAGAVVLEQNNISNATKVLYKCLGADGSGSYMLEVPAGGTAKPASAETVNNREHYIKMKGNELYKWAVNKMKDLVEESIVKSGISCEDIKYIIPHQVNIRIIEGALKRLNIPIEKVIINLDRYGNTSSASIPIALDELNRNGNLKKGDIIVLVAFGSGLTWAACTLKW